MCMIHIEKYTLIQQKIKLKTVVKMKICEHSHILVSESTWAPQKYPL